MDKIQRLIDYIGSYENRGKLKIEIGYTDIPYVLCGLYALKEKQEREAEPTYQDDFPMRPEVSE